MSNQQTIDRIFVGYDASPDSRSALSWAANEAERASYGLSVVAAHGPVAVRAEEKLETAVRAISAELAQEQVRDAVADLIDRHATLDIDQAIHNVAAVDMLSDSARQANLTVLGTGRFGNAWPFSVRSTAQGVLREAQGPIALVPGADELAHEAQGPIVLGIDIASLHADSVHTAFRWAQRTGRALEAVYVWDLHHLVSGAHLSAADMVVDISPEVTREAAEEMLAPFCAEYDDVEVRISVHQGPPRLVLRELVRDRAAMLVVGSHGWSTVERFRRGAAFGSTSRALARGCPVPLVIVP